MREYPDTYLKQLEEHIFNVRDLSDFNGLAMEIFHFQYDSNPVYHKFVDLVCPDPQSVAGPESIPFMPVEVFKKHQVISGAFKPELVFYSSGTSGMERSRHFIADPDVYLRSFLQCFRIFYGTEADYCILALLPSYLEQGGSSLVYMVDHLSRGSNDPDSGFFLYDHGHLEELLIRKRAEGRKVILFGVTYALLDFSEAISGKFPELIVIETGGMKGKREEMVREELHEVLCSRFGVSSIHSEYGMTELLSQAYSKGGGYFHTPPWMKVLVRDVYDPGTYKEVGKSGVLNITDLANLYSCAFIATQDLGRLHHDGSFEVLGRTDTSDIRGCNLLVV